MQKLAYTRVLHREGKCTGGPLCSSSAIRNHAVSVVKCEQQIFAETVNQIRNPTSIAQYAIY